MMQPTKINAHMFNLLIKKDMDNFSVSEARDALMELSKEFKNLEETRKYVYRQILAFERKGWLVTTGNSRAKKYQKTELLKSISVIPRRLKNESRQVTPSKTHQENADFKILLKEKNKYEGELAIVLGEVEEYQSLMERFPKKIDFFLPMFTEAKDYSAKLLGKINALSKVLLASKSVGSTSC
ncbi:hypothetical protein BSZ05_07490 [Vibrio mediterranei]|uniref:Response regulator n=2 Tax=Vibrio mediterranei TaxID=689 RepID=A0AAN1FIV2_9VIBR|nr:hypothetical protein BSZ05_07490 [Vibrio mediterranei]